MHFPMVVNWWEKKECGHDAKEGTDKNSVYSLVPLKSVGLNLLIRLEYQIQGSMLSGSTILLLELFISPLQNMYSNLLNQSFT